MNARLLAGILVLPLLMAGGDPKKPLSFKEFAPRGVGFSILMPGEPKEEKKTEKTTDGKSIDVVMYRVELSPLYAFVVAYADRPEASLKGISEDQQLDTARDAAVRNTKGKLLSEKKIKLGKYAGRELQVDVPGKGQLRGRMYTVDNRLYEVMMSGTKEQVGSKDATKFLDSFKLTKK